MGGAAPAPGEAGLRSATLLRSERITPAASPEEVRHLVFRSGDGLPAGRVGQCVRVMAPGQFGNRYHPRLYSIADPAPGGGEAGEFSLCVRRCSYVDDFSGERYPGVASNYLCDLRAGAAIAFAGPVGYPFPVPQNDKAGIIMIGMGTGIAPFRGLVRLIYEQFGGWKGKVRLYYGARSGLEMLYMNEENKDLAKYFDEKTFKAFQAVSPRPHFEVPADLEQAIAGNAAETWAMLKRGDTHVYVAGAQALLETVERALAAVAGSPEAWQRARDALVSGGRWSEVLY